MKVAILKSFPYAHDGLTQRMLKLGTVEEVQDRFVEGLRAAGYVGDAPKEAAPPVVQAARADRVEGAGAVTITEDWRALEGKDLMALAAQVSTDEAKKPKAAVAIIERELARRDEDAAPAK